MPGPPPGCGRLPRRALPEPGSVGTLQSPLIRGAMKTRIVRIGNSQGVRIPKPLLDQAGLPTDVELQAEDGRIAWTGRAGVLAVRRVSNTISWPAEAREMRCDTTLAARRVRLGTSAFFGDFGPIYTVRAGWASPNGGQVVFLGYAQDSTGQREILTVL